MQIVEMCYIYKDFDLQQITWFFKIFWDFFYFLTLRFVYELIYLAIVLLAILQRILLSVPFVHVLMRLHFQGWWDVNKILFRCIGELQIVMGVQ